ncbi:bacteriocin [Streptococcus phocae subsp. salmonis]|uniref:bacteriocin n=1 Tax=Streptococcus phocae TaxID=119224 RepID=UPI000531098A|nr:bacteriocin [Streptococcus phocae]KGR73303.1 hypothetical protein NX86_01130 [Streptococcus phocae subsp. salmonis]
MENKKFKTLTMTDLQNINGGDNESYDFWYRIGKNTRKAIGNVGKAICGVSMIHSIDQLYQ